MATLTATSVQIARTLPMTMSIQGVGKQYRTKNWGLRNLTLELGPGMLALLEPNGAGKSTLMRILTFIGRAKQLQN